MSLDSLGDRMKKYEHAARTVLPMRMPVILRVDGKAFHTWTRGMNKPFDLTLMAWMNEAASAVCQEVQGAKIAYVQSDEINVLVHNYARLETQSWFDNCVQKMVSVSASVASARMTHLAKREALFDARVFVLPEAEVANYFLWRQNDWTRNSVQMLARSLYSHAECENKDNAELQEMCWQKGRNWNDLSIDLKRGRCVLRHTDLLPGWKLDAPGWIVDANLPIFKAEGRTYIERHLATEKE